MMAITNIQKNQHLMWRAGFGPAQAELRTLGEIPQHELLKRILEASAPQPVALDVASQEIKTVYGIADNGAAQRNPENGIRGLKTDEKERRRLARLSRQNIKALNHAWIHEMVISKQQLREKMALFWHGHFAANSGNILHHQQLLQVIRTNALESFAELLKGVSKSAAILNFLNNNQNRKNSPNENFAREVMELFTLGRGHYSEADVKAAARAFTGWGTNLPGHFTFRKKQHDEGLKTMFGKSGHFNGDDVLDMLLAQKQTAIHITKKIYRYCVTETIDNEDRIKELSDIFYDSGYNISQLLTAIFSSEWFYEEKYIANRIKSPVDLMVGIRRIFNLSTEETESQLQLQRLLGQLLFYPPNVAGWPGGYNWIDSSALMLRLQLPELMTKEGTIQLQPKSNDDEMMGMSEQGVIKKKLRSTNDEKADWGKIEWSTYVSDYDKVNRSGLFQAIASRVLVPEFSGNEASFIRFTDQTERAAFIRSATIRLMSTPEYQLS